MSSCKSTICSANGLAFHTYTHTNSYTFGGKFRFSFLHRTLRHVDCRDQRWDHWFSNKWSTVLLPPTDRCTIPTTEQLIFPTKKLCVSLLGIADLSVYFACKGVPIDLAQHTVVVNFNIHTGFIRKHFVYCKLVKLYEEKHYKLGLRLFMAGWLNILGLLINSESDLH